MDSIENLIKIFSKFPTVGPRTAARFAYYLVRLSQNEFNEFASALNNLRKNIKLCPLCFNPSEQGICRICQNSSRDSSLLCVIEKEGDLTAVEKTKNYKGLYFILGGLMGLKRNKENLRINELKNRIKNSDFKEIIIGINPTPEGETTSLFLEKELKEFNLKITRLGRGLPVGGELEYADEETLSSAFQRRN